VKPESALSRFLLGAGMVAVLHITSVIHAMLPELPENRRKESVDSVLSGINPVALSDQQLRIFSQAYGIAPVALIAKEAASEKVDLLPAMNPKLMALVTTMQVSKGKIALQRNGKTEFADVQLGDKLYEFTVTEIDDKKIKLVNGEQQLLLEVFTKPKAVIGQ
jgi:hypothetical protein